MRVRVFGEADDLAELAASTVARWLSEGEGRVDLALAGGSSPRPTYVRLREEAVPWDRVDAWLGDERWAPPGDQQRNETMVREALVDHVPVRFLGLGWGGEPDEEARRYEEALQATLGHEDGRPRPHVVLMGLGEDGHTASLFPGTAALEEERRLYVANRVPQLDTWRVTATLPLLRAARRMLFLVTGAQKADAVASVLEGSPAVPDPPARLVLDGPDEVIWFLDRAAASRLERTELDFV